MTYCSSQRQQRDLLSVGRADRPGCSKQIGVLFQVARFDSSEAALDPDMATSDTDIQGRPAGVDDVEGHGSIWMLLSVDQESRATT